MKFFYYSNGLCYKNGSGTAYGRGDTGIDFYALGWGVYENKVGSNVLKWGRNISL